VSTSANVVCTRFAVNRLDGTEEALMAVAETALRCAMVRGPKNGGWAFDNVGMIGNEDSANIELVSPYAVAGRWKMGFSSLKRHRP
jgi:hypothetical protein